MTRLKVTVLLAIEALCLFEFVLRWQISAFDECQAAMLSLQWTLMLCIVLWCGFFIFLTFSLNDLPLTGLLLIATAVFSIGYATTSPAVDAIILLAGVTLGRGAKFLLKSGKRKAKSEDALEIRNSELGTRNFLIGLVLLLSFAAWWHLDIPNYFYQGRRWTGLWNNPNLYGMLMGAGLVLAAGLLAGMLEVEGRRLKRFENEKAESGKRKPTSDSPRRLLPVILFIAAGMIGVGLVMSYSRGAWVGTSVGLLYLAKAYREFKWRFVLPWIFVVVAVVWFFWGSTPDTAPWYMKRMDFGRASAQHRIAAWKAGFEIMRDHPLGVGWNKAVEVYDKNYSPPEHSAAAITTNDYLMLGTQLGLPGLVCFVAYVALCFRQCPHLTPTLSPPAKSGEGIVPREVSSLAIHHLSPQMACRAGALTMLVAFWFDDGLFTLPTASVFWILLELGNEKQILKGENGNAEMCEKWGRGKSRPRPAHELV